MYFNNSFSTKFNQVILSINSSTRLGDRSALDLALDIVE